MLSAATKLNLLIAQETYILVLLKEGKTPEQVAAHMSGVDIEFIEDLKEMEGL